jgi:hypothetical protein
MGAKPRRLQKLFIIFQFAKAGFVVVYSAIHQSQSSCSFEADEAGKNFPQQEITQNTKGLCRLPFRFYFDYQQLRHQPSLATA